MMKQFFELLYQRIPRPFWLQLREFPPDQNQPYCRLIKVIGGEINVEPVKNHNSYYGICPRNEAGKPIWLPAVYTDIDVLKDHNGDYEKIDKLLGEFPLQSSILVQSGGGYHNYFLLQEPIRIDDQNAHLVKGVLKGVATALSADLNATDISRIFRIPGTKNFKREETTNCEVISSNKENVYAFEDFESFYIETKSVSSEYNVNFVGDIKALTTKTQELIKKGAPEKKRSVADFHVVCELVKRGWSDSQIKSLYDDTKYRIGEKYREKRSSKESYLGLTIKKVKGTVKETKISIKDLLGRLKETDSILEKAEVLEGEVFPQLMEIKKQFVLNDYLTQISKATLIPKRMLAGDYKDYVRLHTKKGVKKEDDGLIRIRKGCYYFKKLIGEEPIYIPISNFVIEILEKLYSVTENRTYFFINLKQNTGWKSKPEKTDGTHFAIKQKFLELLSNMDSGINFWGNTDALNSIWAFEKERSTVETVQLIDHLGFNPTQQLWFLGDKIIKNGEVFESNQDDSIIVDGERFRVDRERFNIETLPSFKWDQSAADVWNEKLCARYGTTDLKTTINKLLSTIFGGHRAAIAFGWTIASVFRDFLLTRSGGFPFLCMLGRHESGKTLLGKCILRFWGFDPPDKVLEGMQNITNAARDRLLNLYSYMPLLLDEIDNSKSTISQVSHFKAVYSGGGRTLAVKGSSDKVINRKAVASIILTGESIPSNEPGLLDRLLIVNMSKNALDIDNIEDLFTALGFAKILLHDMLIDYTAQYEEFGKLFLSYQKTLQANTLNSMRLVNNFAMALAGYQLVFGKDSSMLGFVLEEMRDKRQDIEDEMLLNVFLGDLFALFNNTNYERIYDEHGLFKITEDYLAIKQGSILRWWSKYRKEVFSQPSPARATLRSYFADVEWGDYNKSLRIKGISTRCIMLYPNKNARVRKLMDSIMRHENLEEVEL